jgi:hypothetical protein
VPGLQACNCFGEALSPVLGVRPVKVGVGAWYEPACNMQLCDGEHASLHAYIIASTRRCTHATCDGAWSTHHLRHHGDNVQS